MAKPACDNCKFWEPRKSRNENEGQCHRNAPSTFTSHTERSLSALGYIMWAAFTTANTDEDDANQAQSEVQSGSDVSWAFWPVTMDTDWCGEFRLKSD